MAKVEQRHRRLAEEVLPEVAREQHPHQASDDRYRIAEAIAEAEERMRAGRPDDIRAKGWAVAVHNDYRLDGEEHTFWLFTRNGRCVKGEGRTDAEALAKVRRQLKHYRKKRNLWILVGVELLVAVGLTLILGDMLPAALGLGLAAFTLATRPSILADRPPRQLPTTRRPPNRIHRSVIQSIAITEQDLSPDAVDRRAREWILSHGMVARDELRCSAADVPLMLETAAGPLYPGFQFDPLTGEPRRIVTRVSTALGGSEDPWGVAGWWLTRNLRLGGVPPAALAPEPTAWPSLLAAAEAALKEDE